VSRPHALEHYKLPEEIREDQPSHTAVVWQENRLAEARFNLTLREFKLVAYVVAMIEPGDDSLKLYKVHIRSFAEAVGVDPHALYQELRETALGIKAKPLVIKQHMEPGAKGPSELITSWFSDVVLNPDDEGGYFGVSISHRLRPYLLQVKRDFFKFRLSYVLNLDCAYAMRLYQVAKRWQFVRQKRIPVDELRHLLGTIEIDRKGRIVKESLPEYSDFKRRALIPAVNGVNAKTDIKLSFTENKVRGTRRVESITFRIAENAEVLAAATPHPQLELSIAPQSEGTRDTAAYVASLRSKFGLSALQSQQIALTIQTLGMEYVAAKVELVESKPRNNAAGSLVAAIRDDWQPPMKLVRAKKPKPSTAPQPTPPALTDEERARSVAGLRAFREKMKGGPTLLHDEGADDPTTKAQK
jgi:plasmid replication initiation protein